ncbi:MAG: TIGR02147 family protein [Bdellovibrionales bacterium]|nr:TIGR02147 family protein [Bdellovibrionales bacterium]
MSVFRFLDYRDAISEIISESKSGLRPFSFSGLADAAQVQKPYVTRVFKKEAHFNSDQLFLIADYLGLNQEEADYLMILLEFGRSSLSSRKKSIRKTIHDLQAKHLDTRKHLAAEMVDTATRDEHLAYYLDPMAPLVHAFLSVPRYAREPKLIGARLGLSEKRLAAVIEILTSLKIIKSSGPNKGVQIIRDHMQLVSNSPATLPYQIFQRTNAIHQIQTQSLQDRFIFSVAFSADENTKTEIHEAFLKFLRKAEALVKASQPTEIYQMNFDLFGWG